MDYYTEDVLDHYEHPRNQGELTGEGVLTERDANASCGDMVQFYLKVSDGVITEVRWKGMGCAVTTAAASKLSEWLKGKKVDEIKKKGEEELLKQGVGFEVNPGRIKCLTLPVKLMTKILGN